MAKIAVMGDRDSIYGFSALGLDIHPVEGRENAARLLKRLANNDYAVIYITEAMAGELEAEIDEYRACQWPAIIPIPGVSGNTGLGIRAVKKSVEQAVGSDLIFNN